MRSLNSIYVKLDGWLPSKVFVGLGRVALQKFLSKVRPKIIEFNFQKNYKTSNGLLTTSAGLQNLGSTLILTIPVSFSLPTSFTPLPSHLEKISKTQTTSEMNQLIFKFSLHDLPVDLSERGLDKLADTMNFIGGNHIVLWSFLLQHKPHCLF